jgi:pantothenate kinase
VLHEIARGEHLLSEGALGIDAGLTLTKIARWTPRGVELTACETAAVLGGNSIITGSAGASRAGITGARGDRVGDGKGAVRVQEIEAAAHGACALLADAPAEFVLALLGTGTAFAAVRGESIVHVGGTAMGGGSFTAIARRIAPALTYREIIECAARGDRRNADLMVADAYADGIGRIGGDMTAAHLAKDAGSLDDFLAALLNMHGENIAQIAAGRGVVAGIRSVVLTGGFAHLNPALVESISAMARLFGVTASVVPHAGFAGAIGAAMMACRQEQST